MQIACRAMGALEQALYACRPAYQSDRPFHGLQANRCLATGGSYDWIWCLGGLKVGGVSG
jgi:hypothetical protein